MSILDEILTRKREEVATARRSLPTAELEREAAAAPPAPDFSGALRDPAGLAPRLIAEVKQRSPSKGLLCADFDPLLLAQDYAGNGAAAISVLTDEHYFGGSLCHLRAIATLELGKPLLRKDFIFDRYQLLQARAAAASAALLIVAMLPPGQLTHLLAAAAELQLAALVEVHTRIELDAALSAHADIIGVNNRDLHTFETNLDVTATLRPHIPAGVIMVAESGIHTLEEVQRLAQLRVDAMLIGESLVTAADTAARVREFAQRTNDQQPTTTAAFVSSHSPPIAR
jgi:indole-3-glycerol phosphate synthase